MTSDNIELIVKHANELFRLGNFDNACSLYKSALDRNPSFLSLEYNIGLCNKKLLGESEKKLKLNNDMDRFPLGEEERDSVFFDREYYLREYPDVEIAGLDPETHYFSFGEKEHRKPNQFFDPVFYNNINADVRLAGISAFKHYCSNGFSEGRAPRHKKVASKMKKSDSSKPLLFIGHDGIRAGAQVVLLEIVRWFHEFTRRKINVLLLSAGPMADEYSKFADIYVLHESKIDCLDTLAKFLNQDYEFCYLSTVVSGRFLKLASEANIKIQCPVLANIHEMERVLEIFSDEMVILKSGVDHWISGSPGTTDVLLNKYSIPEHNLSTISAFVKPIVKEYSDEAERLRAKHRADFNVSENKFVIVGCGTVYWRKGPDLFVQAALELIRTNDNFVFIWIGDGPDLPKIRAMLTPDNEDKIRFIGQNKNASEMLSCADLFFLSSREDPFPLVVLHAAQYGVPSICFAPSTGVTEFIKDDAGVCIPVISAALASEEINKLSIDRVRLKKFGMVAKERLFSSYTPEQKVTELYCVLKNLGYYKPSVSVIVPIYNHAPYIDIRLKSILDQQVKDIEVIILDDASSDNSVEIAERFLKDGRVSLQKNVNNSGSPFHQWRKGIGLSKSDIIWIAEGDDDCKLDFLNILLPYFEDSAVNIACAKMEMIDENGNLSRDAFKPYFDSVARGKFDNSYVNVGHAEVAECLAAQCTLINASGLLIRKSSFGVNVSKATNYKMCGDWLVYLECLQNGKIAYDTNATNYFRRHSSSQVHKIEGTSEYFKERYNVACYIADNYIVSPPVLAKMLKVIDSEWDRFKDKNKNNLLMDFYDKKQLVEKISYNNSYRKTSVLVVASDFSPGGGQLFSIRLANALHDSGVHVVLFNVEKFESHPKVLEKIHPNVKVYKIGEISLKSIVELHNIGIIHSSIWWADKYVYENLNYITSKIRWVISMHGCYETLLESTDAEPCFLTYFENMLCLVDCWVYTAEKNKKIFESFYQPQNIEKVLNGYKPEKISAIDKHALGIRPDAIVVCLASRAIASKGWFVAVEAIELLNKNGVKIDLLLIGEGEAAEIISQQQHQEYIKIVGQVSNLADYISISDVGLLPSTFIGESMPLVLIEFLAQGKPIVSTNVGEIPNMIQDHLGSAGIILDVSLGHNSLVQQLVSNLEILVSNSEQMKSFSENAKRIFQKFSIDNMIDSYSSIYSKGRE